MQNKDGARSKEHGIRVRQNTKIRMGGRVVKF